MEVRVLGPLLVERDGVSWAPEVPKVRALLAVLALRVGTPVSVDELVAALWGDDPPTSAAKTLQGHVSTVRRLLGPAAVATVPPSASVRRSAPVPPEGEVRSVWGDSWSAAPRRKEGAASTVVR